MDELRILVCGDREWTDCSLVRYIVWKLHEKTKAKKVTIIEGEARGADTCGRRVAETFEYDLKPFPADWKRYGRGAGPIRNSQQLREGRPDITIGFHDNISDSRGTMDMLNKSVKEEVPTILVSHKDFHESLVTATKWEWRWWGVSVPEFDLSNLWE